MATAVHTPATLHILTQQIYHHLDADLPDTANFLAGRLHALEPRSPESAHLLALTYFRLRRYKAAADSAHKHGSNGRHLGCAYLLAQSCLHLGRATEGITALEKSKSVWSGKGNADSTRRRFIPDAPSCWTLLGKLWQVHGDLKKSGDCFVEAHKSNPFTWEAFEGLCKAGADLNIGQMFKPTAEMGGSGAVTSNVANGQAEIYTDEQPAAQAVLAPQLNFNQQVFTPSADPFAVSKTGSDTNAFGVSNMKSKLASKAPLSDWDTPTTNGGTTLVESEDVNMSGVAAGGESVGIQPPAAPARRTRPGQQFETGDRPRQPALRGQAASASESVDEAGAPPPQQHSRKPSSMNLGTHKRTISGQQPSQTNSTAGSTSDQTGQQPIRRSNRLFGQGATSSKAASTSARSMNVVDSNASTAGRPSKTATGAKGRIGSTVGRVVSGNRKVLPPDRNMHKDEKERHDRRVPSRTAEREKNTANGISSNTTDSKAVAKAQSNVPKQPDTSEADYEALTSLLDSLRTLAQGTYATTRFDTPLAIRVFRALPSAQRETPFVLAELGKAHYEAGEYKSAEEAFARCLKLQPSRVQDMEVYSTVLWHMKKDAALAFLCHMLRESDSNAPETWVAVGNAFSLSREHDQAIAAFKRAVQVSPTSPGFAYAWTLMGHEYMANEDFDSALSSFRHSVASERRGYGGWYGLGKCSERMGKLEEAERHYRIAASLNPANATLLVCIGVVLERLRNRKAALANYTRALELAPTSALARFKKARVLMHLRHLDEALVELGVLREQAPEEANVWYLLGKCYKGLGERGESLRCFTSALNLDVKAAPLIKEAMEALDEDEDEDEMSDEE